MLQIRNIKKKYVTGELVQTALGGVSLSFRDNEFVAVLGPSGSGKTTLLNIIGGLDRYDDGDLIIGDVSTKKYRDRDWDSYRNHTIGFVFQSYNLIPHQSILSNVELALTISGVTRDERRKRARKALETVGLGDQLHKKPNQMSGGQMQRVAIARALVNNPDILLADEPTGALDTETSIQVMNLLKEVAKDRLVIMVTHNPELAEEYATRIVKMRDGMITDDTNPFDPENEKLPDPKYKNLGKASMSFRTALSLSFKNLMSKKGRTVLTSFAGSIGIIGIALILALSTGVNTYIADIQKETMSSYPITLSSETLDMSSIMTIRGQMIGAAEGDDQKPLDGVYSDSSAIEIRETMASSIAENDLTAFKKYLDNPESEIRQYIGENGIVYSYDVHFNVYSYNEDGHLISTDADTAALNGNQSSGFSRPGSGGGMNPMSVIMDSFTSSSGAENFEEVMKGADGSAVSAVITDSYDVLYGNWPEAYNEVVIVLDENNSVSTSTLYQLGLITEEEYKKISEQVENGEEADEIRFDYADICNHSFYMVPVCDTYTENDDGTFTYIGDNSLYTDRMLENAVELKISGVIRPIKDSTNATIMSSVAYTSALTDYIIDYSNKSAIITAQEATPDVNVLTGMIFEPADDEAKANDAKEYMSQLNLSTKATLYQMIMMNTASAGMDDIMSGDFSIPEGIDPSSIPSGLGAFGAGMVMDESTMAAALDMWLENSPDKDILVAFYDEYIGGSTYDENMSAFGKVSLDAPNSISIYTDSFEDKDNIAECIVHYNETADEESQITYTDYVALMTSSLTTIVNVISYVLIAFVSVSLIVSCIMIGIITHISVMERTKEIGILRAIGASKRNISQVFNAETFIIGICSGLIGVGISELLTIPINAIIHSLTGLSNINAVLSPLAAAILVVISIIITLIGGLIPAKKAAKKDPVIALRTE